MNLKNLRASKVSLLEQVYRLAPNAKNIQEALATTDVAKFLIGSSAAIFNEGMAEVPTAWDAIFQSVPSSSRHEPTRQNNPGANLPEVPENGEIPFGKIVQPTIGFITNHKYAELFDITEEMVLYNEIQRIADSMRELGERAANTMEQTAMAVVEDSTAYASGLTGSTALSKSAVQEAITAIMTQTANGKKLGFVPDTLFVPASLQFNAMEIVESDILIGTPASNVLVGNKNGLKGFLKVVVGPQLTDQNNWYVGKAKKGLRMQIVLPPYLKDVTPMTASTGETVPTVEMRRQKAGVTFGAGFSDNRYWYGSFVS